MVSFVYCFAGFVGWVLDLFGCLCLFVGFVVVCLCLLTITSGYVVWVVRWVSWLLFCDSVLVCLWFNCGAWLGVCCGLWA